MARKTAVKKLYDLYNEHINYIKKKIRIKNLCALPQIFDQRKKKLFGRDNVTGIIQIIPEHQ